METRASARLKRIQQERIQQETSKNIKALKKIKREQISEENIIHPDIIPCHPILEEIIKNKKIKIEFFD